MDLIKIKPDTERAKSLLQLSLLRIRRINGFDINTESALLAETYYEICKELITALLFIDGYKTLSHKDLVEYIKQNHSNHFSEHQINSLDTLRKKRNKIVYYGVFVDSDYIKRNKNVFEEIISQLRNLVEDNV